MRARHVPDRGAGRRRGTAPSITPADSGPALRCWRRSPLTLADAGLGLPGEPDPSEARWCEATVDGIRFASTYVPNGRSLDSPEYPRKLAFLDAVARRAATPAGRPRVIAGDFNIAPADIDVYDPAAFVGGTHVSAPGARAARADPRHRPDRRLPPRCTPTSSSSRGGTTAPATSTRASGCESTSRCSAASSRRGWSECGIDRNFRKGQKPSDHAPLLVTLT